MTAKMATPEHAARLSSLASEIAALPELPSQLVIVQLSAAWRTPQLRQVGRELDAVLLRRLLRGEPCEVRRLVLYDIPSDEGGATGHGAATEAHREMLERLARHHAVLRSAGARHEYRQWVLGRAGRPDGALPAIEDGWRALDAPWASFDSLWADERAIGHNPTPPGFPVGPPADRSYVMRLWDA